MKPLLALAVSTAMGLGYIYSPQAIPIVSNNSDNIHSRIEIKETAASNAEAQHIQVAILLDTSGSMDGLIDQAKTQLWKIVNELALAKDKNGNIPKMELALYEYGNDRLSADNGYILQVAPLTTDLDLISEKLFDLRTNGGSEYCGQVIQTATQQLQWSANNDDLKLIFIAGNEEYTQGNVNYKTACKEAISKGIMINTIFCGEYNVGAKTGWEDGASCADGKYMNINHNQAVAQIDAPQDIEINDLNQELNNTYYGYGNKGKEMKSRQMAQDTNAKTAAPAAAAERAATKASPTTYKNSSWDIVDAAKDGDVDLKTLSEAELPDEMKNLSVEERAEFVKKQQTKREEIQKKIQQLSKERRDYIEQEQRKQVAQTNEKTLDQAFIETIREQIKQKGLLFPTQ